MKKILLVLLGIIIFAIGGIYLWLMNSAPVYSGEYNSNNISDSTEVVYDKYGVPHIYANNAEDAYYALGYAHAQERLFQMDILRRLSTGQLAEILGASLVKTDKKMISLGFREFAEKNAVELNNSNNTEIINTSKAYLKGINDFIAKGNLPIEFTMLSYKPNNFTIKDIYSTLGYMALGFSTTITSEPVMQFITDELGEEYAKVFEADENSGSSEYRPYSVEEIIAKNISTEIEAFPYDLPLPYWEGSNSWLLSKNRSKSGKALFANDTHIGYSQPAVWFEAYISYPNVDIYGYYLAGMPFAIIGHNNSLAWGITIFPLDNMDLYYETVNPDNKMQYRQGDKWLDYEQKTYSIKVKDAADVDYVVNYSQRGPIINNTFKQTVQKDSTKDVSLWWVLNHSTSKVLEATYEMSAAKHISEFETAVHKIDILGLNMMYADKDDNIAWWATGYIPKRNPELNSKVYLDGATDTIPHENYPLENNPKLINPERGYIITANNSPGLFDSVSIPGYYAPGLRARRIEDLLLKKDKWSIEEFKEIQLDVHSDRDLRIRDIMISQLQEERSPQLQKMTDVLASWNGDYNIESVAATIYSRMIYEVLSVGLSPKMGNERFEQLLHTYTLKSSLENLLKDDTSVWWSGDRKAVFNVAFDSTLVSLTRQLGDNIDDWKWKRVHQLTHVHPIGRKEPFDKVFNVGPFEKTGSLEVIDKEGFVYSDKPTYKILSGPALRLLVDFAKPDSAIGIIPTGQSGNFLSPHYSDQAQMFVDGKYRRHIYTKDLMDVKNRTILWLPQK